MKKINWELVPVDLISLDYDDPNAIQIAVEEAAGESVYLQGINLAQIPLIGTGKVVERVWKVKFSDVMAEKNSCKFANPLTVLKWTKQHPEWKEEFYFPLWTLFSIEEQLFSFCLFPDWHDEKTLCIKECTLEDISNWQIDWRMYYSLAVQL